MACGKNRFSLLEDEEEDSLELTASASPEMKPKKKKKKKKKKAKQPAQIPSDANEDIPPPTYFVNIISTLWSLLSHFFGFAFLLGGTAMYCPIFTTFLSCRKPTPSTERTSVKMDRYCTL
jgi:hypothetical protein